MKAWIIEKYGPIDDLKLSDYPDPRFRDNEVLIRIHAAALNPADLNVITGLKGGRFMHARNFPFVLGYDFSGVVSSAGKAVRTLKAGDAVFGFLPYSSRNRSGAFAQYVAVDPGTVATKPESMTHVEAASIATVGCTALQGLRDKGRIREGDRVLVNGASGGVGSLAVQIAKNAGATVWGTASNKNLAFVKSIGADYAMDYKAGRFTEWRQPFDIVFDVSATSSYGESAPVLKRSYVTLLPSLRLVAGMLRSALTPRRAALVVVTPRTADLQQLASWIDEGKLKPVVSRIYPMSALPEALHHMQGERMPGKIALQIVRD